MNHAALVGKTFNAWTVLSIIPGPRIRYFCRCSCGGDHSVDGASVRSGASKRCRKCADNNRGLTTHGATRGRTMTPEFQSWRGMLERCSNPRHSHWRHYGGRGITVCVDWIESFAAFLACMGPRPSPRHSIDRYPNRDGNYEPGNVRWATPNEQASNTDAARMISHNGDTHCLSEWARRVGVSPATLHERLSRGWPLDRALARRRSA